MDRNIKAFDAWKLAVTVSIVFTGIIWLLGANLEPFIDTLLPDQGATWYYWKLPARQPMEMLIVWSLYIVHQLGAWISIYWAQRNLGGNLGSKQLTRYNIFMLTWNTAFMVLHLVETQLFFDGLAQDVPIWTSQGSVILMLVFVLIIENRRRGLILGKKLDTPFTAQVTGFFRRIHMYVVAWALVYTFWFHPMAVDPQLISGFIYMFFLFTQMSLAWTWIHLDKRWIVFLESYVALHALIVAVYNTIQHGSAEMWPMFFAGFAFMFVFTYQFALELSRRVNIGIIGAYIGFLVWLYAPAPIGYGRGLEYITRAEFLWIPIILYLLALVFAGAVYAAKRMLPSKAAA
ncbi:MAG: hypothetical protein NWF07_09490 [Candidatus Bathyarchaeota archaeon]|nr:hypothetical protein [Candidatus Bathyarchaeota archaeon]